MKFNSPIDPAGKLGRRPLHIAAKYGHYEICLQLLNLHANVNAIDSARATPLHFAVLSGKVLVVNLLIERGANVTLTDQDGWNALDFALINGNAELIDKFKKLNLKPRKAKSSKQPLEYAEEWQIGKAAFSVCIIG